MALVEIRPLPVKKWHGKEGKEDFTQPKAIEVLINEEGKYATGLTDEEAVQYGKLLGVDLGNAVTPDIPHPYWSSKAAWIYLPNHTMVLDTNKPADFIKVKNLKASKYVANSLKEKNEGLWPYATHVIFDETEEVEIKAAKSQNKSRAYVAVSRLSVEAKAGIVQVLTNKSLKDKSTNFVDVEMEALIEKDPNEVIRVVDMGKEEVTMRSNIIDLLTKNILTKQGTAIFYMGEQLAMDYEGTVEYFKDPNNQRMKVAILEKLNK